jgi:hypothetical protein
MLWGLLGFVALVYFYCRVLVSGIAVGSDYVKLV